MSLSYILSVKRLQRTFGALHAKDPGPACPIMMHHHMIHILMESVGCSRTNVPESTIELNKRQYIFSLNEDVSSFSSRHSASFHLHLMNLPHCRTV